MNHILKTSFFLGIRSALRGNRGISIMTILMMAIIYINLLFLPSIINGAIDQLTEQIIDTATSDLLIKPGENTDRIDNTEDFINNIKNIEGVDAVTSTFVLANQLGYENESKAIAVEAIDPDSYAEVFTTPGNMIEGQFLTPDSEDIFLGIGVAGADRNDIQTYNQSFQTLHSGDTVQLSIGDQATKDMIVSGIYWNQFPFSDNKALVTQEFAASLNPSLTDTATAIYVRFIDSASEQTIIDAIYSLRSDIDIETKEVLTATIQDQVETFDLINNILKIISLIVAAITVFIITYVDLVNKRRQIGIERAIGIRSSAIVISYILKALAYSIIGVAIGLLLYFLALVPYFNQHPFEFPNGDVVPSLDRADIRVNIIFLLIVAVIGAIIPAWRSVRLKILDAIWGK